MGYSLWGSKELDMMCNFDSHFFLWRGCPGLGSREGKSAGHNPSDPGLVAP